jgi:transcriptional regulator with XRE-family HTH domain
MGIARQSPPSPELKVFSDRLREAIEFKKIDIPVLAKEAEYKPDDIHKLLAGMREPGFKKLTLLANSLGCSVDYLLGLTPRPQRASIVIEADTNALNPQPGERGQTSGQISGIAGPFVAMMSKLMESDIELLMYLAGFLVEKREKMLAKIMGDINAKPSKETGVIPQVPCSKNNDDSLDDLNEEDIEFEDEFEDDDDDFDEDDLEDEDFDDEDFEDEDEDLDDDFD